MVVLRITLQQFNSIMSSPLFPLRIGDYFNEGNMTIDDRERIFLDDK